MKKIYAIIMFVALLVTTTNVSAQADAATLSNIVIKTFTGQVYTGAGPLGIDFSGIEVRLEQDSFVTVSWTVSSNNTSNVERNFLVGKDSGGTNRVEPQNVYVSPGVSPVNVLEDYALKIPLAMPLGAGGFFRIGGKIYNAGENENAEAAPNYSGSGWMGALDVPLTIVENGTLSTSNKNAFEFAMYPNPVKDMLYINSQEKISKVVAIDMLGRTVLEAKNVSGSIDVSSLKSAMYIVKLSSDKGVSTKRFLKL